MTASGSTPGSFLSKDYGCARVASNLGKLTSGIVGAIPCAEAPRGAKQAKLYTSVSQMDYGRLTFICPRP